jgi:putative CocE/NonD family hydrolase
MTAMVMSPQRRPVEALQDDFYLEALSHPTLDGWWRDRITLAPDHQAMARHGIAIMFSDGWRDYFLWPMTQAYRDFAPLAKSRARLIVGPWEHASSDGVLPYTYQQFAVLWLDRWLRGIDNGVDRLPRVLIYVQGPNQWRFESNWPLPDARKTRLYLRSQRSGTSRSGNDGTLSTAPPGSNDPAVFYRYVPGDANTAGNGGAQPAGDQSVEEATGLTWTTAPLELPTEVTGPLALRVWASADTADTDFVVEVTDVAPDGSSTDVTRAWLKATHRVSDTDPTPLVPGTIYPFSLEVWPTSYVFQAGHRIRLAINGADIPGRLPNPNPATQSFYQDATHPSYLELPTIGESGVP